MYIKILAELGYPRIYLVPPEQYEQVDGEKLGSYCGSASVDYPVVTIHTGLSGKARRNTIYHELGHHLFPSRRHWWVECFAEKMARGGGRGYWSKQTGHTVDDLPHRSYLLKLARRASARFNERTAVKNGK